MIRRELLAEAMYPAIKAADIESRMADTVVPYLESRAQAFSIERTGAVISGVMYTADSPRGTVMLSHGFTESIHKFRELIYYFLREGFNVCAHDHRGHGGSRSEFGGPTDTDSFETYVADFAAVADKIVKPLNGPKILFAHSMGGLIAALYLEQHPELFGKAVLSSPLFELNRGGLPYFVARGAAEALCLMGKGRKFLPGQSDYSDSEDFEHSAASCRERYHVYYRLQKENKNLQNGGSSCRWARAAFRACRKALKRDNCAKVKIPVLLFQAENDSYVLPGGQEAFLSRVPDGKLVFVPHSKHEIYMGSDDILPRYLSTIFSFIS